MFRQLYHDPIYFIVAQINATVVAWLNSDVWHAPDMVDPGLQQSRLQPMYL